MRRLNGYCENRGNQGNLPTLIATVNYKNPSDTKCYPVKIADKVSYLLHRDAWLTSKKITSTIINADKNADSIFNTEKLLI